MSRNFVSFTVSTTYHTIYIDPKKVLSIHWLNSRQMTVIDLGLEKTYMVTETLKEVAKKLGVTLD